MEPDDIPVHDLLGVGGDPEPGPKELRAIVARAGRKRWVTAGIAATLALALGLGIGVATSSQSSTPASQTATASPGAGQNPPGNQNTPGNAAPSAASGSGASSSGTSSSYALSGPISPERFTRLFTRTANGVTIRGFLVTVPQILGLPASCQVGGSRLRVEVSTDRMVGAAAGGLVGVDRSQPVSDVTSEVVGAAEGGPTAVVTAATGPGVARVSMSFAGGATDAMTPVNGWVALAAPVASSISYGANLGTITAASSAGKVVKSQPISLGVQSSAPASSGCSIMCSEPPQAGATPASTAAKSASASRRVACPPLPCPAIPTAPRVTVPPNQTPPTITAPTAVNPGGPVISSAGSGVAGSGVAGSGVAGSGVAPYACVMPAPAGGAPSGSSGASP
jgi:hypothetical protein